MKESFTPVAWKQRWNENRTNWHLPTVNSSLKTFWPNFCPNNITAPCVFVPLCGKSLDLLWMYSEKTCTVIGCDLAETAIQSFTKEQENLKMKRIVVKFKDGQDVVSYQTPDSRLRLYVCDLFAMHNSPEEKFPLVWDRGSLVAMDPELHHKYVDYITSLCSADVRWLLETYNYPEEEHQPPPCRIPEEELHKLFDDNFNVEILHTEDIGDRIFKNPSYCYMIISLLTRKSSQKL